MQPYALMKESGAGTLTPKVFHPECDPDKSATAIDPPYPFIQGKLVALAGTNDLIAIARGAPVFGVIDSVKYVRLTSSNVLIIFETWAEEQNLSDTALKLFDQAFEAYPDGFYWAPVIHPRCVLYKKGKPRQLRVIRKDGKLYLPLLVQRMAVKCDLVQGLSYGLSVTGTIADPTAWDLTTQLLDGVIFPAATGKYTATENGWTTDASNWWEEQRSTITHYVIAYDDQGNGDLASSTSIAVPVGTFDGGAGSYVYGDGAYYGVVSAGVIVMTTDDIANLRSLLWPSEEAALVTTEDLTEDITTHLQTSHGLTEIMADALYPAPTTASGAWRPGIYTSNSARMFVCGYAHNKDAGDASSLSTPLYTNFSNIRTIDSVNLAEYSAASSAPWYVDSLPETNYAPIDDTVTPLLTNPLNPESGDILPNANATAQRVMAIYNYADYRNYLTANIVIATGYEKYYVESVLISIRAKGIRADESSGTVSSGLRLYNAPTGVAIESEDETAGIIQIRIYPEQLGLTTSTTDGVKHYDFGQEITLDLQFRGDGAPNYQRLQVMADIGGFQGGGIYGTGTSYEPDALLTEWLGFTPAETLANA